MYLPESLRMKNFLAVLNESTESGRMFEIVERNFNVRRKHGVDYNVWCNAAPLILADLSIFLLISRMKFISGK